jgi:hypothetical protein
LKVFDKHHGVVFADVVRRLVDHVLSDITNLAVQLVILAFAFFQLLENFFLRASRRCSFAHFGKNLLSGCNCSWYSPSDRV